MAAIKAFRALRFHPAAGPLHHLVCPLEEPADDETLRRLYAGNPNNIAHLLFPREGRDPYEQARGLMAQWLADGVLCRDDTPGLYIWEQHTHRDGVPHRMLQLLGMVRLEDELAGTYCESSEPAFDPFHLLCATHANLDAMQALVPDEDGALLSRMQIATGAPPLFSFADEAGASHKLWRVEEPSEIARLTALLADVPLTLTAGKHRCDAALRYRDHLRHSDPSAGEADWALMSLAPAVPENIQFLPTQLILKPTSFELAEFLEECGTFCSIERLTISELSAAALDARKRGETAVGMLLRDASYLLVLRDSGIMEELLPGNGAAHALSYHMLRSLLLERVIGLEGIGEMRFTHSPAKAIAAVEGAEGLMAFLLPALTPSEALLLADSGEKLAPQAASLYPPMIAGHLLAQL